MKYARPLLILALVAICRPLWGDPCGMVPPASTGSDPDRYLTRTGDQITYIFFKNGIQDMVLRPEFKGKITEFGMLIPFPTPPAIRKVADDIFWHCKNAVEPPQVSIDLYSMECNDCCESVAAPHAPGAQRALGYDSVRVIREEAVGMYQAAVLEAGSTEALKKWMDTHGYVFPNGMESACQYYVEKGWCFVAERARIAQKKGVDPKPGMKDTDPNLPQDATFNGALQAMGFRFKTSEPVMPLRLSAHNAGPTHNIVYVVMDAGVRLDPLPKEFVRKQIPGKELYANLTEPLPAKIHYWTGKGEANLEVKRGQKAALPEEVRQAWQDAVAQQRNPGPYNGKAKELIASDLLAARHGRLIHEYEERQKELLNIGEELGLRGPHVDDLIHADQEAVKERALATALEDAAGMTLTVVEGDFQREILSRQDVKFVGFTLPLPPLPRGFTLEPAVVILLLFMLVWFVAANRRRLNVVVRVLLVVVAGTAVIGTGKAQDANPETDRLVGQLWHADQRAGAMKAIVAKGSEAVPALLELVRSRIDGDNPTARGWALVCLARIGDARAFDPLNEVLLDGRQRPLVRLWAGAAIGAIDSKRAMEVLLDGLGKGQFGWQGWNPRWRGGVVSTAAVQEGTLYDGINKYLAETLGPGHVDTLIEFCLRHADMNVRRMAASYLGAVSIDSGATRERIIAALSFDPETRTAPWHGGPLFIPGIAWSESEGRRLLACLIHWMLWSERGGRAGDDQNFSILRNNLAALGSQQQIGGDVWGYRGADWAIAWADKWSGAIKDRAAKIEAGELLVHALESGSNRAADVLKRLRALAGEDAGSSVQAWRKWMESIRKAK